MCNGPIDDIITILTSVPFHHSVQYHSIYSTHPIYGTGQGSANSPAIWCFLSSALLDCYDEVAQPATYSPPLSQESVSVGMIGFVDDCNGQTNLFEADGTSRTVNALVRQAQENAQSWNNILAASGGALEISKTSCHVMQ